MAIHELLPAHKIGPFHWGEKLGRRVDKFEGGISVDDRKWTEEREMDGLVFPETGGVIKVRLSEWDYSGSFVTLKGPDMLELTTWADDSVYGYVQTSLGLLAGEEINKHPLVGKKLRYIPD